MTIGILALQGAVEPHEKKFAELHVETRQVRREEDLQNLSGIVLPGGESTAMIHLLKLNKLWEPLRRYLCERPAWGICAGAILLAKGVSAPLQESLGVLDIDVIRNAYGRQNESFIAPIEPSPDFTDWKTPLEGVFIRAPKIARVYGKAKTLFTFHGEPVMVKEGNWMASTFHPELTDSTALHQYFLNQC